MTEVGKIADTKASEFIQEFRYKKLPNLKGTRAAYVQTPSATGSVSLPQKSRFEFPSQYNYDMSRASLLVKLDMEGAPHELDYVDHYGGIEAS